MTALIAGLLYGIKQDSKPGQPIKSNDDLKALEPLTHNWEKAIERFADSSLAKSALGPLLHEAYLMGRQEEYARFARSLTQFEIHSYLTRV
ncbi:MAG: hypothetical protein AAGD05_07590 [Bacteroidota bacterium]